MILKKTSKLKSQLVLYLPPYLPAILGKSVSCLLVYPTKAVILSFPISLLSPCVGEGDGWGGGGSGGRGSQANPLFMTPLTLFELSVLPLKLGGGGGGRGQLTWKIYLTWNSEQWDRKREFIQAGGAGRLCHSELLFWQIITNSLYLTTQLWQILLRSRYIENPAVSSFQTERERPLYSNIYRLIANVVCHITGSLWKVHI